MQNKFKHKSIPRIMLFFNKYNNKTNVQITLSKPTPIYHTIYLGFLNDSIAS